MLPEKFLERMQNMLGEEYPAFLESLSGKRYRALRLNPLKTRIQEGKEKLPFTLSPVPWTKNGFYYEEEEQPGKHPYHEAGLYYIQEPSAMAPVPCLMEERASAAAIPERQEGMYPRQRYRSGRRSLQRPDAFWICVRRRAANPPRLPNICGDAACSLPMKFTPRGLRYYRKI